MIRFACPSCEKVYKVPDTVGGKPATCTQCRTAFLIPDPPSVLDLDRPPTPHSMPSMPALAHSPPASGKHPKSGVQRPAPPPPPEPEILDAEVVEEIVVPVPLPPPPPPSKFVIPAVLEPCPGCAAVLTVTTDDLGHPVVCPYCGSTYTCVEQKKRKTVPLPPPPPPQPQPEPVEPPSPSKLLIPRELEPCPRCTAVNTVASEHVGLAIECPFCKTVYLGEARRPPPLPQPMYIPVPMFMPPQGRNGYWSMPSMLPPPPPPPPPPVVIFAPPPPSALVPPPPTTTVGSSAGFVPTNTTPTKPTPPAEVEIAPCPMCRAELTVPPDEVGGDVSCPYCGTVYQAVPPTAKAGTQLARVVRRPGQPATPPKKKKKTPYRFWWNTTDPTNSDADDPWPKGRDG